MATMIKELNQGYYIIALGHKQLRSINNVFSNYRSIYLKIYILYIFILKYMLLRM